MPDWRSSNRSQTTFRGTSDRRESSYVPVCLQWVSSWRLSSRSDPAYNRALKARIISADPKEIVCLYSNGRSFSNPALDWRSTCRLMGLVGSRPTRQVSVSKLDNTWQYEFQLPCHTAPTNTVFQGWCTSSSMARSSNISRRRSRRSGSGSGS